MSLEQQDARLALTCLQLLNAGLSVQEIADHVEITPGRVEQLIVDIREMFSDLKRFAEQDAREDRRDLKLFSET